MTALRILCMNIHGGRSLDGIRDLRRLHDLMEHNDIDIGVFQEMETRSSRGFSPADINILAGPERPHCLKGACVEDKTGWYGNLTVSRHPILRGLVHNLETVSYLEPRNAVDILADTPLGAIRVIGTHLSLSPFERWSEGQNLVRLIAAVEQTERNPILLMGDINEWRRSSRLLKHLDRLMTPLPCGATFPSFRPVFRLDRVWHDTPGFDVKGVVLSDEKVRVLSDHLPLIIHIKKTDALPASA